MRASEQLSSTNGQVPSIQGFVVSADGTDFELYPHQQQAIERLDAGDHVILSTPTGSGKSLVALVATQTMLNSNRRTAYTAPTKALVNEKFFGLVKALGADNVGLITGDAAVNTEAPVIACTAEILANQTLRMGADTPVDFVVMDEFHYYGDGERVWAWQVPLLQLPNTQFLLMSGTLGDVSRAKEDLLTQSSREVCEIKSQQRPVPLKFEYRDTPIRSSVADLRGRGLLPVYIVHFTQNNATEHAEDLSSSDFSLALTSKKERDALKAAVSGFSFDTAMGKRLRRCLWRGVGIHHAGMLPKYRLLVEQLAQQGQLKVICGTNTLGVGINVPIRTVLFTSLDKFDGFNNQLLKAREFQQIAGRAGRSGYDTKGHVWVQSPAHRFVPDHRRNKPPDPVLYGKNTMHKLWSESPGKIYPQFKITPGIVLNMLSRPGGGRAELRQLISQAIRSPKKRQKMNQRVDTLIKSMCDTNILSKQDATNTDNIQIEVNRTLLNSLALDSPLSLFLLHAAQRLDLRDSEHHWKLILLVESIVEDPRQVLSTQSRAANNNRFVYFDDEDEDWWDEEDFDYFEEDDEDDVLSSKDIQWIENQHAKFLENYTHGHLHWLGSFPLSIKEICREMIEYRHDFNDYVSEYELYTCEGVLLRYLADCYKTLTKTVPESVMTAKIKSNIQYLGEVISEVDSSLLDEWQSMRDYEQRELCAPTPV